MAYHVEIINPVNDPGWDQRILAGDKASFFHSAAWAATLSATYRYRPCYFVLFSDDNKVRALVPLMEVQSFITGKRGVSLPFSDYCEPILEAEGDLAYLLDSIFEYGRKQGWKYLELRTGTSMVTDQPASDNFLGHTINLTQKEDELFASFRESTRRNIKKAETAEVVCKTSTSFQAIEKFYSLNCLTRKQHAVPPQPFSFFKNVYKHIIARDKGFIVLASHKNNVIAGAIYFHFGRQAMYKYGASNRDYQKRRANYLVMWHAIRAYSQKGFETLDMGRTDPRNQGLNQFKTGWSPMAKELIYYRYALKDALVPRDKKTTPYLRERILPHLPIPLLRMIGAVAYRHVG